MDELFDAVSWAVSWNAIAFLAVAGPASLLGGWLVLRMVPLAIAGREDIGLPRRHMPARSSAAPAANGSSNER